jgi:SPP1 family phage portal protein
MYIQSVGADWFFSNVWLSESNVELREYVAKRQGYWNGNHHILDEDSTYANGQPRGTYVMNWIKEIVTRHTGGMTAFQVETEGKQENNPYAKIRDDQRLERIDSLLIRDSLLCGYGVEFQDFNSTTREITVSRYDPLEWAFLWDSESKLQAAVRCVELAANTVHDGVVLENATTVLWVYTAEEYGRWTSTAGSSDFTGEIQENVLGKIPVIVWTPDEEMKGIVSDELIAMNDAYNEQLNIEGDDIRNTVDSIMKIWGVDSAWATANEDTILAKRMMPFDRPKGEQDAEYLTRELDITPHTKHLDILRENIHIMGMMPDVTKITGATGSTSGIALKLAFTPMEQAFRAYSPFLVESLHERIDLINARLAKISKPTIEKARIDIQFIIPTNRIEEWQNVSMLNGIVSKKTQLTLLTDIEDPAQELQNVVEEMGEDAPGQMAERIAADEERAAQLEAALVEEAARTTEAIAAMIRANEALVQKLIDSQKAQANG